MMLISEVNDFDKGINHTFNVEKAICAFLVISIHYASAVLPLQLNAMARIGVPFFCMVSGYYCSSELACIKRIKKTCKFILFAEIYYFVCGIFFISNGSYIWTYDEFNIKVILEILTGRSLFFFDKGWFLGSLLMTYVVIYFVLRYNLIYLSYVSSIIMIIYDYIIPRLNYICNLDLPSWVVVPFGLFRIFPFFMLGYAIFFFKQDIVSIIKKKHCCILVLVGILLVLFEQYILEFIFSMKTEFIWGGNLFMLIGMFVYAIEYPKNGLKILSYIGGNLSFYIYICHMSVAYFFTRYLRIETNYIKICIITIFLSFFIYISKNIMTRIKLQK